MQLKVMNGNEHYLYFWLQNGLSIRVIPDADATSRRHASMFCGGVAPLSPGQDVVDTGRSPLFSSY